MDDIPRADGHGEIITPEDPRYDPSILGQWDEHAGPRPNQLWGYCANCQQGFRWSVSEQQWRPWPGGLSLLPHLSGEELDELHDALVLRRQQLEAIVPVAQNPQSRHEVNYKVRMLWSLQTAVAEARYRLWPKDGPFAPRMWGEAWSDLGAWVQAQLDTFEVAPGQASEGARLAFEAVKAKLDEMERSSSDEILALRTAAIEASRSEPGSAESS